MEPILATHPRVPGLEPNDVGGPGFPYWATRKVEWKHPDTMERTNGFGTGSPGRKAWEALLCRRFGEQSYRAQEGVNSLGTSEPGAKSYVCLRLVCCTLYLGRGGTKCDLATGPVMRRGGLPCDGRNHHLGVFGKEIPLYHKRTRLQ